MSSLSTRYEVDPSTSIKASFFADDIVPFLTSSFALVLITLVLFGALLPVDNVYPFKSNIISLSVFLLDISIGEVTSTFFNSIIVVFVVGASSTAACKVV